ncbi:MAG: S41 family peptidase [Fibrobacter sp.]|nr:S41 family peptidase [Fibrobacter sp.]
MSKLTSLAYLGGALALAATISGCDASGTEPIFSPDNGNISSSSRDWHRSSSSTKETFPEAELQFNYEVLDYFYLYAHKNKNLSDHDELGDFEEYYNPARFLPVNTSYCIEGGDFERVCNMYEHMSDPFTRYYDPAYASRILQYLTESEATVGIGAEIKIVLDTDTGDTSIIVDQVYENGPSDKAGLMVGDTVVSINGNKPVNNAGIDKLTSGNDGEKIEFVVQRDGETKTITVTIGEFNSPTVYLSFKDSIPVIKVTEFTSYTVNEDGTYGEFVKALNKIKDDYKAVIIDLRDNPGGDVDHCNNMSAELLSKGDTIIIDLETDVDSSGSGSFIEYFQKIDTTTYVAEKDGIGKDLYYVFLADSGSASCAEVMLSAATVNKKSPVVGQTSYGKGIGQYVIETYASGLSLVTGLRSMDKDGGVYHKVGIEPDYPLNDENEQMAKALEIAKNAVNGNKEERTKGYGTTSTGHFAKARSTTSFAVPRNKKDLMQQMSGVYKFKNR